MAKKKETSKKAPKPPAPAKVIDLDALLGESQQVKIQGRLFDGRECNLLERDKLIRSQLSNDADNLAEVTLDLLNARVPEGEEPVTAEWLTGVTISQLLALFRHYLRTDELGDDEGNV